MPPPRMRFEVTDGKAHAVVVEDGPVVIRAKRV